MDPELEKQLAARMAELPEDVRAAIESADFGSKVQAIGAKHQLHIDQIGQLEDEVLLVMLAFSNPDEFVQNLMGQLHIANDVANIIADEVSNDILLPIRASMQAFMEARAVRAIRDAARESIEGAPAAIHTQASSTLSTPPPATPAATPAFTVADNVLAGKTVATPPPGTPRPYTADPYREPIE